MFVQLMGFDYDAGVWRSLVCNAAGKLIIDPTEIFEDTPTQNEHGKAPTSAWAFNQTGTRYLSLSGCQFVETDQTIFDIDYDSSGCISITYDNIYLVAHINLPHGAIVTGCVVYGLTGSPVPVWQLNRHPIDELNGNNMCSGAINNEDTTISTPNIDNSQYAYFILISTLMPDDIIYGARISYTI
jgi:hypothetical protein